MDSAELRRRAEVDLGCGPFGDGLEGTRPEDLIHELRLHRTELELQNDELRRVQHEIEESRDRFQELFELSPCGYLTLDVRGGVWEMNRAAERILRVSRNDLLQQPLAKMMSE